jgi:hypothetical protein
MSSEDEQKKRKMRNFVVGGVLFALVVLFYLITIVKMAGA